MSMSREELERIKEAEKEHLRSLKKLKEAARQLESRRKTAAALGNVADSRDLLDKTSSAIDQLAVEVARNEARLEIAFESAQEADKRADLEQFEEEELRKRAAGLIQQIRREASEPPLRASQHEKPHRTEDARPDSLPEKTIGRIRRDDRTEQG
jgi:ABC-type transporter Mla subunit MlaD